MTEDDARAAAEAGAEAAAEAGVVYVLDVADKPGIAHAVAAVFAHRGLSMRAVVADASRQPPRILVVFCGTPRQCRLVQQVLERLHDVQAVRVLPMDDPALRAVAVCRCEGALPDAPGVDARPVAEGVLLSGSYAAVDAALARFAAQGRVREVSRSLVVV